MKNFEFKRIGDTFRWESDFLALVFSYPSVQGVSDYINLTSEKEIMYYYYTVEIFKKVSEWDDEDNEVSKWELVSERNTHDFPKIVQLKWLLDYQLSDKANIDGQKIEYSNGDIRYAKTVATEGFACDDFYEITKSVNATGNEERYIIYCGTTFDTQGDLNSVGIRTPYVTRIDVEELLTCVTGFIQHSLEQHNKEVALGASCYEVKHEKIYEYGIADELINRNIIESIYIVGDRVYIKTVVDNQEQDYDKVVITKIEGDHVFLNTKQIIKGSAIVYIGNEPTKEVLTYKEQDIAKEFMGVLSSEEQEEFRHTSVENLAEKYKMAIIDRTWMCRDEHEFNMDYDTGDRVKAVTPIVKEVIRNIKENLVK